MSTVADEPTSPARRPLPRGRAGAGVGVLLLAAAAYGLSAAHVVGGSTGGQSGSGSTAAVVSSGGGNGGAGAGAGGGSPGASASPSGGAQAAGKGATAGPGGHATPAPTPGATFDASKTLIAGEGNWRQSNCEGGFEPGETCAVSYQGEYYLAGAAAGTVVMTATAKDGRVLAQQSYSAPTGGHRYGALLKFTVPKDVTVIDMMAVLQDAQGHVIARTPAQESYAA